MEVKNQRERKEGVPNPGKEESPEALLAMGEHRIREDHQGSWGR